MTVRGRLALVVAGVALVGVALGPTGVTLARFTDAAAVGDSVTTDTLAPPTGVAATGGAAIGLSWTPTVDTYASGYELLRSATSGSGHALVATVTPASSSSTTDSPGTGTWYYLMRSIYQSWLSVPTTEVSATVDPPITTALAACTTTAADTSGAGDNNGYQSNPLRACVNDSSDATDANSGRGGTQSCGTGSTPDARKDRHRFWGFAHGVPGTASVIEGITVRADIGLNNNGGSTAVCAQLSWDGGVTWTTMKSVAITGTAEATYVFGGAADTWGRTWTAAELSAATFRVRHINASSQTNKRFDLDYVAVSVTYRP